MKITAAVTGFASDVVLDPVCDMNSSSASKHREPQIGINDLDDPRQTGEGAGH